MAESVDRTDADRITVDPASEKLRLAEEGLFMAAKRGSLWMPKMTRREWAQFREAVTIEENERKFGIPEHKSELTSKHKAALDKIAAPKSKSVQKMLDDREDLIPHVRPQCVDPNDEAFEDEILEELGMTAEEFSQVDKRVGNITPQEWENLQALNEPSEEDEEY